MDPYLEDEALWPWFQQMLVQCLHHILPPNLFDRYRSRVSQRRYVTEEQSAASGLCKELHEDYLEICQQSDGRLITLVDVVSPANKATPAGRKAYLDQRREAKNDKANIVEIDLVLQGQPTLEYSRDGLPHWNYAITVTRATQPDRYEIYITTLQKKLPRFRLPLAPDDRDTVIDLQWAFTRCFEQGGFAEKIDYRRNPPAQLAEGDRRWMERLLMEKKLRECQPADEEIAHAAYLLWEEDGCVHGRDREHWFRAIEQLKEARSSQSGRKES
jgi:hypothetical protein